MPVNREVNDFAVKLRLTALVLGCTTLKALDAAFRAADPNTAFDLSRAYKWMQGRAVPRAPKFYEEWAALLDCGRDASWLTRSRRDAFTDALSKRYGVAPERLLAAAGDLPPPLATPGTSGQFLCGTYAMYVPSQSPHHAGRILRGSIVIEPSRKSGGGIVATLVENFAGLRAAFTGPALLGASSLTFHLNGIDNDLPPVFCALFRPTPPASLLAGIISSFIAVDPGTPPYASRFLAARVPRGAAEIERSNRYLPEPDPGEDLALMGLQIDRSSDVPARMAAWLFERTGRTKGAEGPSPAGAASLVLAFEHALLPADPADRRTPGESRAYPVRSLRRAP